jgi:hypothetical protein
MNYDDMLKELDLGNLMTRPDWETRSIYCVSSFNVTDPNNRFRKQLKEVFRDDFPLIVDSMIMTYDDNVISHYNPEVEDIEAEDWMYLLDDEYDSEDEDEDNDEYDEDDKLFLAELFIAEEEGDITFGHAGQLFINYKDINAYGLKYIIESFHTINDVSAITFDDQKLNGFILSGIHLDFDDGVYMHAIDKEGFIVPVINVNGKPRGIARRGLGRPGYKL